MNNKVDKILSYLNKFTLIFSIICLLIALIGSIFFYINRSYKYFNPILLIIGSIIYLFLIFRLYKIIQNLNSKKKKMICILLLFFQFVLLCISTRLIHSIPKVDLVHILTGINSLKDKGFLINNEYFSVYPNNRFILIILYYLSNGTNNINIFSIFSALCISVMSLFTYLSIKEISNENNALIGLFICVFSPIFYLYVSYYYTDIISLPFSIILFYLVIKNEKTKSLKTNIIISLLIGIVSIIGYKIRAVSIFILIAYFVYLVFKRNLKKLIKIIIPIFVTMLCTLFFINSIENNIFVNVDRDKEFPLTHWIMMGTNKKTNGYYSQDDYNLSASQSNVKDRINMNITEIKKRIKKGGILGNIKLFVVKIIAVWGKGDYSYQKYLDLSRYYNVIYDYLLKDKNTVINYILQISKIGILVLSLSSLFYLFKKNQKSVIAIAIFGAIIFYLIWEVCPRYGLSFLPWLIILSQYSFTTLEKKLYKIDNNKTFKYIILFLTLIIFLTGFNKYTNKTYKNILIAKDTTNKIKYISLDKNNSIEQSLNLSRNFNKIKLKFKYDNENTDIYNLKILNSNKEIVYNQDFEIKDLKNKKYTTFSLNKTMDAGLYYVKLTTSSSNPIKLALSYKKEFDFYPSGKLLINNNYSEGDLMFEVIDRKKTSIYSIMEYIILSLIVIFIEYIVFIKKSKK